MNGTTRFPQWERSRKFISSASGTLPGRIGKTQQAYGEKHRAWEIRTGSLSRLGGSHCVTLVSHCPVDSSVLLCEAVVMGEVLDALTY